MILPTLRTILQWNRCSLICCQKRRKHFTIVSIRALHRFFQLIGDGAVILDLFTILLQRFDQTFSVLFSLHGFMIVDFLNLHCLIIVVLYFELWRGVGANGVCWLQQIRSSSCSQVPTIKVNSVEFIAIQLAQNVRIWYFGIDGSRTACSIKTGAGIQAGTQTVHLVDA